MNIFKYFKNKNLFTKALKDTNAYFLAHLVTKFLSFFILPFLARTFTTEQFAQYDLFLISSTFLTIFIGLGLDSGFAIIISEKKNETSFLSYLFTRALLLVLSIVIILWAISWLLINFIDLDEVPDILIHYLFIYVIFYFINNYIFNFVRWLGKANTGAILGLISSSLGIIIGFLLLIIYGSQVENYLKGLIIGNILGSIASIFIVRDYITLKSIPNGLRFFKELIQISLPYVPTYLSNSLIQYVDRIIILTFLDLNSLALYGLAHRLTQIPLFGINIISKGFLPVMLGNYETDEGKYFNRKVYTVFIISLLPIILLFIFFSTPLIEIFGGEKYISVVDIVPTLILAALIYGGMAINGFGFIIKRKTVYIMYITAAAIIFNVIFSSIFVQYFDIFGVAFGTLLSATIVAFAYTRISENLYKFEYPIKLTLIIYFLILALSLLSYFFLIKF